MSVQFRRKTPGSIHVLRNGREANWAQIHANLRSNACTSRNHTTKWNARHDKANETKRRKLNSFCELCMSFVVMRGPYWIHQRKCNMIFRNQYSFRLDFIAKRKKHDENVVGYLNVASRWKKYPWRLNPNYLPFRGIEWDKIIWEKRGEKL